MSTYTPPSSPLPDSPLPAPRPGREPLAFAEWWDDLLWPRVLAGAGLGIRPNRIGVAFFLVVLTAVLLGIGNWVDAKVVGGDAAAALANRPESPWLFNLWGGVIAAIHSLVRNGPAHPALAGLPWRCFVAGPLLLVRTWPVSTLVVGPLLLLAWSVGIGAIARMAAVEVSHAARITWIQGLSFAARRWKPLVGAVLAPVAVIWVIALIAGAFGFLLLRWPAVNIVGAVLYGIVLALSVLASLAAGGYVLGLPMLAPAVVCEGTDAIDAMQRAFAYVTARLPRLLLYLALAAIGVAFVTTVVALLAGWTLEFGARASGAWAGDRGREMLWLPLRAWDFEVARLDDPGGTFAAGAGVIRFWVSVVLTFVAATLVSCAGSASAVLYLSMRQVCDGQDLAELWSPGVVEGAMSESMAGRGELTRRAVGDTGAQPPAEEED